MLFVPDSVVLSRRSSRLHLARSMSVANCIVLYPFLYSSIMDSSVSYDWWACRLAFAWSLTVIIVGAAVPPVALAAVGAFVLAGHCAHRWHCIVAFVDAISSPDASDGLKEKRMRFITSSEGESSPRSYAASCVDEICTRRASASNDVCARMRASCMRCANDGGMDDAVDAAARDTSGRVASSRVGARAGKRTFHFCRTDTYIARASMRARGLTDAQN